MTLEGLLIWLIRLIRRTDTFIHDVTSSFHLTIASYYSDGDRLHFRRNKHVQHAVKINTEDKRRETCTYSYVYLVLVSREITDPANTPNFKMHQCKHGGETQ